MQKPVLVIMAAGLGSRFGGQKQVTPVDDAGHLIIDFSIFDARRAGFETVIFVIQPWMEESFHAAIGGRIAKYMEVRYAYQTLDQLPEGIAIPEGRTKPWGTGHAALCAAPLLHGPFAVINADDFYGQTAFAAIYDFLNTKATGARHAMVGYRVENTLTENGSVARGVCAADAEGMLTDIHERTHIEPRPGGAAFTEDGGQTFTFLPAGTPVSMNLWGFSEDMKTELQARFGPFLMENLPKNPLKCEYFLPYVPNCLIEEGTATVAVLPTDEKWYGVTYAPDLEGVKAAIARMKAEGRYPAALWE